MIDLALVSAYVGFITFLGLKGSRLRRAGMLDYVLAGRTLTLPMFVSTLVPTFYGGVLGIGEFTWQNGLSNWTAMALPYYVFAALYAFLLAGRVRLEKGLTIADHMENSYGRPVAVVAGLLIFVLACPADELLMTGTLLAHLSGLTLFTAMGLAAIAGLGLVMRGGLRSDVWANRLELCVMFGGFFLILPFAVARYGGPQALIAGLPAGHLSLTGGMKPLTLLSWWLIALWTFVDPSFHQRCAAAADPATARKGILVSILFWAVFDLMTTTAGLYSRLADPDLAQPMLAYPVLADRLLPVFVRGLFFAGMLSSMFAALQGTSLVSAVSLGKDVLGNGLSEAMQERRCRFALCATGALAFLLAWVVPSVVGLWYAVGSAVVPGLLLPLLGVYFPRLRVKGRWALGASLAGCGTATAWLLLAKGSAIDPMFAGLAASAALWLAGLLRRRA